MGDKQYVDSPQSRLARRCGICLTALSEMPYRAQIVPGSQA